MYVDLILSHPFGVQKLFTVPPHKKHKLRQKLVKKII
jgi:hypothetical protein